MTSASARAAGRRPATTSRASRAPATTSRASSALAGTAAFVTVLGLCGCTASGTAGHRATTGSHPPVSARPATTTSPAAPRRRGPLPVNPGAGRLPQTMTRPATHGRAFHAMITDLWLAVRTGKPTLGRQAFFPVDAYKQVKAISDPAAD